MRLSVLNEDTITAQTKEIKVLVKAEEGVDFKDFDMSGHKVGVGQLELVSLDLVADMMPAIEEELGRIRAEGRHSASSFSPTS